MDTAAVLAKIDQGAPEPMISTRGAYGPWFQMMGGYTELSDEELAGIDIGFLNLLAALGLPGAENLDVDACVQMLNSWAQQVQAFTIAHWHLFQRSPEKYGCSAAQFRILALVTVLHKHIGVGYNLPFMEGDFNATDSRNLFIHGILHGPGGTCSTMPVLDIAIGRRLGYPLKLVRAKDHMFARWDELGGERFNIESTSPGFEPLDDEHYRHRPHPLTEEELRSGFYLRSLRPREELAVFLCHRADCLMDNLRPSESLQSCYLAAGLALEDPGVRNCWSLTTIMARALEDARQSAGLGGYRALDLRTIPVPEAPAFFGSAVVLAARENLNRIARIHEGARTHARSQALAELSAPALAAAYTSTTESSGRCHVRSSVRTVHQ